MANIFQIGSTYVKIILRLYTICRIDIRVQEEKSLKYIKYFMCIAMILV